MRTLTHVWMMVTIRKLIFVSILTKLHWRQIDMEKQRMKVLKPRDCERILNYNGFYPDKQNGCHVIFKDDLGRHITIPRGNINPLVWKRLAKEYNLVEPSKVFK